MIIFCLAGIGASGSVYGLMLFLTVDRIIAMRTNTDRRNSILLYLILLVLLPVVITIVVPIPLKINVAHSAHFGGGLVGFLFGVGLLGFPLPCHNQPNIYQMICRYAAFIILCIYYVIILTIFFLKKAPIIRWILYKF